MTVPVRLRGTDQGGLPHEAKINKEGAISVVMQAPIAVNIPPEILTRKKLFYEFFRVDGVPTGSRDMHLATTATEFRLSSQEGRVRWIKNLRIIIEGRYFEVTTSGDFRRFGSVAIAPGLTNGIELYALQGGVRTDIFLDPVRNMGDFFVYATGYSNFVNAVSGQDDFLSIDIDMSQEVTLPLGIEDRLVCKINDNMVNADFLKMHVLAKGYQEVA